MKLNYLSLAELQAGYQQKKFSAHDVVSQAFARLKSVNLGPVFLGIREQAALKEALAADQRRAAGKSLSPLDGVPIALKDNIAYANEGLSCASRFLENYCSPYDSHVAEKLKAAGAIVLGRTNMDEFAMGSSNENSAYGSPKNPWDPSRVPGGSSGGSAAAVAAGIVPLSLGSDTGGSVRLPASFCGTVGLKPTYGRISRYGLVAFASSLDQIGPMSWWVEDCAKLFDTIAGFDKRDSTSASQTFQPTVPQLKESIRGVKLGIPKEYLSGGLEPEVEKSFREAVKMVESLGAKTVEVSLPHTEYAVGCYYIIACAEASANLARFDGVRFGKRSKKGHTLNDLYVHSRSEGFGPEVQLRILLGTFVLSSGYLEAYYGKGQKVRQLITQDFSAAFEKCDALMTPTAPFTAFKIGAKVDNPLQMYLCDIFTTSMNLAGLPAVSLPCGFDAAGMPIGLQFAGKAFDEGKLLALAYQFEQAVNLRGKQPQ